MITDPDEDPISPTAQKLYLSNKTIGDRLELIRHEKNLSKGAFSRSIGITPQTLRSMLENNYVNDPIAICIEYKHGINRDWLVNGEEPMFCDLWEKVRAQVEYEIMNNIDIFMKQKLKRVIPLNLNVNREKS